MLNSLMFKQTDMKYYKRKSWVPIKDRWVIFSPSLRKMDDIFAEKSPSPTSVVLISLEETRSQELQSEAVLNLCLSLVRSVVILIAMVPKIML